MGNGRSLPRHGDDGHTQSVEKEAGSSHDQGAKKRRKSSESPRTRHCHPAPRKRAARLAPVAVPSAKRSAQGLEVAPPGHRPQHVPKAPTSQLGQEPVGLNDDLKFNVEMAHRALLADQARATGAAAKPRQTTCLQAGLLARGEYTLQEL